MRDQTEWTELVLNKVNTLTGANKENILLAVNQFLNHSIENSLPLYGKGNAGKLILDILMK